MEYTMPLLLCLILHLLNKTFLSSPLVALAKKCFWLQIKHLKTKKEEVTSKCHRVDSTNSSTSKTKESSLLWKFCDKMMDDNSESESSPESAQSVVYP